ncbi:TlpA family protein disulfide reductase [Adhaeribacter rhizoryzae]|uniref:Redoxin domain-containing protein n=1 Tax=Adhaeribacter rhizoryzae TaxID=2607907 RepID=A0A5M6CZF1_9BACT|nr:redoxin domain-containing protein [Adhaeribacter rhizoryzae]KAA5540591.1 redoxin domain-containing protein [Adhaeribacter rhizoryzae]
MKRSYHLIKIFLFAAVITSCNNPQSKVPESQETATQNSQSPVSAPPQATEAATDLPQLPLTKLDGTKLMANNLTGKTILFFFQPDCDHCQRETAQIRENLQAFRDYQVYFITNYPQDALTKFAQEYKLAFEPNFVFAQASIEDILNTVGPMESPSMFIYTAEGRLVKAFKGETPITQILPAL